MMQTLCTSTPVGVHFHDNRTSHVALFVSLLMKVLYVWFDRFESWFDFTSLSKEGGDEEILKEEREKHVLSMLHQVWMRNSSLDI